MVAGWEPVRTDDGTWTLAHPEHGETCHSRAGAWEEAVERYAAPCALAARARAGEVRLLDVGTGIGLNLAAALDAVEGAGGSLVAASLELAPEVIEAALALPDPRALPAWGEVRRALAAALADPEGAAGGLPLGDRSTLALLLGDARARVRDLPLVPGHDVVFLDPFSPRRAPELWEPAFLAEVARRLRPGGVVSTYSVARACREGLGAAGLRVEDGPPVGRKRAGTLAYAAGSIAP